MRFKDMAVSGENNAALAVLIDADNASPAIIEGLLAEVAKLGIASVKRIYGDWTTPNLGQWKTVLLEHSIQPIQQFRYTTGKNATDSAMIIDAMDLLYTGPFAGFCLVSSDSDFTRLASRIRESGKRVYGFGEQKTPRAFVSACDRFVYTEVLSASAGAEPELKQRSAKELRGDSKLLSLFRLAIEAASDENGWAHLGGVGSNIVKQAPDFDPRNYGYSKLSELAAAIGLFEIDRRDKGMLIRDGRKK
ncbi:NYN domain-containing protein [Noviherbaspirillum massiliense]|uniref:NYN domain-containing protein n=1 Tax=Noviherbaspirillum massiliense TaxID=1465823 RepID=UPI0002D3D98D